ncbi:MAG: hypothetical protein J2P58_15785 [Acidimicrobiaceae bacterium]|nr:hypothetical protein [Acidimicrobiaceae bacterium]
MLAVNTTVVAVVSADPSRLEGIGASNVRVLRLPADIPALDRAVEAAAEARRTTAGYFLHDADPLARVADAWAARFEGSGIAGDLEVAVAETVARWRTRALDLPDYYLLDDPESLSPLRRHWYLGLLGSAAPARVVTLPPSTRLMDQLPDLGTGPWWPALDRVLADVDRVVPEQVGRLSEPEERPALIRP